MNNNLVRFENNDKHYKYKIDDKINIDYKPDDVIISTMTIICKVDSEFNVENIGKYISLHNNGIIQCSYGKDVFRTLINKKKKRKNKKNNFYNQVTLLMKTKRDDIINIKLFKNGSIQMTGCKSIEGSIEALEKLLYLLKKEKAIFNQETNKIDDKPFVSNSSKLNIKDIYSFKIAMINSNFHIGFSIDRTKLYNLMVKDKIDTTYDPIRHAGVIIKYETSDRTISVFIFQSGSIVITGAQNCKQIYEAYQFINKYLLSNYNDIVKTTELSTKTIAKYLD